ncbi:MAG: hypothetical protein R6W68_09990 [Ignavibacteriaceae bacterium]
MSRRKNILIILIPVIVLIVIFLSLYVLNVYGDVIIRDPENLFADHNSIIKIEVVPVNAFGWKIPFRKSRAEFEFIEGENLIEVIEIDNQNGFIKLRSKSEPGRVEISVKSRYSLLPNLVIIEILTLTV